MTMEQHLKDETKKRSNLEAAEKPRKKPGRKPSTEKPKTKRAEQTRAAQRAFRERKEQHLKDLEDKVALLEGKFDSDLLAENEKLRNQVKQLETENNKLRTAEFTFSMPVISTPTISSPASPKSPFTEGNASDGSNPSIPLFPSLNQFPKDTRMFANTFNNTFPVDNNFFPPVNNMNNQLFDLNQYLGLDLANPTFTQYREEKTHIFDETSEFDNFLKSLNDEPNISTTITEGKDKKEDVAKPISLDIPDQVKVAELIANGASLECLSKNAGAQSLDDEMLGELCAIFKLKATCQDFQDFKEKLGKACIGGDKEEVVGLINHAKEMKKSYIEKCTESDT